MGQKVPQHHRRLVRIQFFCSACHSNPHLEAAEAFLRLFRAYAVPPAHSSITLPIMHHEKVSPRTLSLSFSLCIFLSICLSQNKQRKLTDLPCNKHTTSMWQTSGKFLFMKESLIFLQCFTQHNIQSHVKYMADVEWALKESFNTLHLLNLDL